MKKHGVCVVVKEEECKRHQGEPYTLKWMDKLQSSCCRSRLVVREIKLAKTKDLQVGAAEVFSAMPPSEGLKTLISCAMTDGDGLRVPVEMGDMYGKSRWWVHTILLDDRLVHVNQPIR